MPRRDTRRTMIEFSGAKHGRTRIYLLSTAMCALVLAGGMFWTEVFVRAKTAQLSASLLLRARTAAASFSPQRVALLQGQAADAHTQAFQEVKQQLERMRWENRGDVRFLYLTGVREDKILFWADAEPPDSKDYSPPGSEYRDSPPDLRTFFAEPDQEGFVVHPYTDAWGTWVSAFAPIVDPSSGQPIAVLGMDVDARAWGRAVAMERIAPLAITFSVLLFWLALLVFFAYRQRSLDRIAESEKLYRTLFDNMLDAFVYCRVIDDEKGQPIDFEFVDVNAAYERHTGLRAEDTIGKRASATFPAWEEGKNHWIAAYAQVLATGKGHTFELYSDSLRRWLSVGVYIPKPGYFAATFEDVSEAKQIFCALQNSEARANAILDTAVDGIIVTDEEGVVQSFNAAAQRMFGRAEEEILGQSIGLLMPESFRSKHDERLRRLAEAPQSLLLLKGREVTGLRKDGSCFPIELSVGEFHLNATRAFAGIVRDITDRKRNECALVQQTRLLQGVAEVANRLLMAENYAEALAQGLATLTRAADVDRVRIFERHTLPETGQDVMTQRFCHASSDSPAIPPDADVRTIPFARIFPRWRREILHGRVIKGTVASLPYLERRALERLGIRAFLGVPIFVRGLFWGIIGFDECRREREWSDAEVASLSLCAEIIGGAVTRNRAEKAVRQSKALLEAIHDVQAQFIAETEGRDLFVRLLESVLSLTQSSCGRIARVGHSQDGAATVEAACEVNRHPWPPAPGILEDILRRVVESGEIVTCGAGRPAPSGAYAMAGLPLRQGRQLVGAIALGGRKDGYDRALVSYLRPLLTACAGIMGAHCMDAERRRAEEAVQRQREWLEITLSSIGDAVMAIDTEGNVTFLNPVAQHLTGWPAPEALGRPMREIFVVHDAATSNPIPSPADRALRERRVVELSGNCVLKRRDGSIIPIDDSAAPIVSPDGRLHGAVLVFRDVSEQKRMEQEMLDAREHETEIGARIQQTLLLGRPPHEMPALQIDVFTAPSQRIDGDFYDFFRHGDDCLDLVVGDVMGKGVPAALVGAATKGRFHQAMSELALAASNGGLPAPADIVNAVHRSMTDQLSSLDSFVTLCYARFRLNALEIDYVDCGHTKTIHYHAATGECTRLAGNNVPLGVLENEVYAACSRPFEEGDVFVFYSDGLTEAANERGELLGEDLLLDLVQRSGALSSQEIIHAIWAAVVAFSENEIFSDDLTALVVKIGPAVAPSADAVAEITMPGRLDALSSVRGFVRDFSARAGLSPEKNDAVSRIELGLDEAIANVVRHGYHHPEHGPIHIRAEAFPDQILFLIDHWGKAFSDLLAHEPSFDGSQSNGFGLHIIQQCFDEVNYLRDRAGRNRIRLLKRRETHDVPSESV